MRVVLVQARGLRRHWILDQLGQHVVFLPSTVSTRHAHDNHQQPTYPQQLVALVNDAVAGNADERNRCLALRVADDLTRQLHAS